MPGAPLPRCGSDSTIQTLLPVRKTSRDFAAGLLLSSCVDRERPTLARGAQVLPGAVQLQLEVPPQQRGTRSSSRLRRGAQPAAFGAVAAAESGDPEEAGEEELGDPPRRRRRLNCGASADTDAEAAPAEAASTPVAATPADGNAAETPPEAAKAAPSADAAAPHPQQQSTPPAAEAAAAANAAAGEKQLEAAEAGPPESATAAAPRRHVRFADEVRLA